MIISPNGERPLTKSNIQFMIKVLNLSLSLSFLCRATFAAKQIMFFFSFLFLVILLHKKICIKQSLQPIHQSLHPLDTTPADTVSNVYFPVSFKCLIFFPTPFSLCHCFVLSLLPPRLPFKLVKK